MQGTDPAAPAKEEHGNCGLCCGRLPPSLGQSRRELSAADSDWDGGTGLVYTVPKGKYGTCRASA